MERGRVPLKICTHAHIALRPSLRSNPSASRSSTGLAVLCPVFSRSHRSPCRKSPQSRSKTTPTLVIACYSLRTPQTSGILLILLIVSNPNSLLALTAAPLAAQAFTVETPVNWLSNTTVTVNWTSVTTDPEFFTIEVCPEAPTLRQKPLTTHPFCPFHSYSTQQ